MRIRHYITAVKDDEDGAVTVDWVVLTAAIVTFGAGVASVIAPNISNNGTFISEKVVAAPDTVNLDAGQSAGLGDQ